MGSLITKSAPSDDACRRSTVWKAYYPPTLPWAAASLWRRATRTTRLGSANHWNPRAGGVPEPRHPHGDTPGRGACHSHPALHCTAPGRADEDGIIPLPMPRRARFQLPSTLPPPHSAHPVTLPMPPRCSSPRPPPKPLPVGAQPGTF